MKKFFPYFLLIFTAWSIQAQNNSWIDLFSYNHIKQILPVEDKIIAVSENAFFTYNPNGGEIEKFSSVNGLTGDEIARIHYNSAQKKLFVIYVNGWIQIIDEQKKIISVPDLYMNTYIPENKKKCNEIVAENSLLYLAMDYGISEFDLEKNEFGDSFFIGTGGSQLAVQDIALKDHSIYAATPLGLKKANRYDLLIDSSNWPTILPGNWLFLDTIENNVIGAKSYDVYKFNPDDSVQLIYHASNPIKDLQVYDNYISLSFSQSVRIYNSSFSQLNIIGMPPGISTDFTTSLVYENRVYAGTDEKGILDFDLYSSSYENLLPDGPIYNDPFGIDANNRHIWVVYGKHSTSFNPYPLLKRDVNHFNGTNWINIPYSLLQARSLCYVKMHPLNPEIAYISSGHDGLIKIENNTDITRYNELNSSLDFFVSNGDKNIRVFGMNFDNENNLFVTQTGTDQPVKVLYNDGTWGELHFNPGFFSNNNFTDGIRSLKRKDRILWLGTVFKGVVGYNLEDDNYIYIKNGIEPASRPNIQALDMDFNNRLWVGNHRMLRYLDQPENAFQNPSVRFKPVKIEYEGSVQLLLEGQSIIRIQADGNNNKWIATSGNGVYCLSENGKEVLYHFTQANSPLPSNDIYDLDIDHTTGIVYFATSKGLVGYRSKAFDPSDDLNDVYAFPNPVITKKHNEVTIKGLIKGVNVKIIDVEGNLVYETVSKGGSITWNLTAFGKHKVATGVYIALITNEDGTKTQTTKILIIR